MRKIFIWFIYALFFIGLSGCASKQQIGALTGGAVGAALGSQVGSGFTRTAASIGGSVAGSLAGGAIGRAMDRADHRRMNKILETTRTGETATWENPDTRRQFSVTPTRTYNNDGTPCRNFRSTALIGGKQENLTGTACRTANGDWRIVNQG